MVYGGLLAQQAAIQQPQTTQASLFSLQPPAMELHGPAASLSHLAQDLPTQLPRVSMELRGFLIVIQPIPPSARGMRLAMEMESILVWV